MSDREKRQTAYHEAREQEDHQPREPVGPAHRWEKDNVKAEGGTRHDESGDAFGMRAREGDPNDQQCSHK